MTLTVEEIKQKWDQEEVVAEPNGDRIFVRWVCLSPASRGWDDWRLVGLIRDRQVAWTKAGLPKYLDKVKAAIEKGESSGHFSPLDGVAVWWVRSILDGPPGDRISDLS